MAESLGPMAAGGDPPPPLRPGSSRPRPIELILRPWFANAVAMAAAVAVWVVVLVVDQQLARRIDNAAELRDVRQGTMLLGLAGTVMVAAGLATALALQRRARQLVHARQRYRRLFEEAPEGVALIDPDTFLPIEFNAAYAGLIDYPVAEAARLTIVEVDLDHDETEIAHLVGLALREGKSGYEGRFRTGGGGTRHVVVTAQAIDFGHRPALLCVFRDVTAIRAAATDLRRANDRLEASLRVQELNRRRLMALADLSDALHAAPSLSAGREEIERAMPRLFAGGAGRLELDGRGEIAASWGDLAEADPRHAVLAQPLAAQGETVGRLVLIFPPGREIEDADRRFAAAAARNLALALANIRLRDDLREQAIRDPLTGLFNRRYMVETLTRELHRAQRGHQELCLAMADIDHFKRINDRYGHDVGDAVLRRLADHLVANTR
ncbi:MAG: GGDEF domain-containing protein, partial [Alphaproteobacteria bacterium]|nr:GGDEF domain-containing protein [Alphaproteobacteria bacterium]